MNWELLNQQIENYQKNDLIKEGLLYLLDEFELNHPNFGGFVFREEQDSKSIVITTHGDFHEKAYIHCPNNILDFDLNLVLNLLVHEMVHVRQRESGSIVEDKNEREWQAYYEMLLHIQYSHIPKMNQQYQVFFAKKAMVYYSRMGENSPLQQKYALQHKEIENLLTLVSETPINLGE